jgi:sugar O-acyltransferase (sialic acid O-acetyltransferase NeuD family)
MQKKTLILIGGGGHCRSCIDVIEQENVYQIEGILDSSLNTGELIDGYPVIGNDSLIEELVLAQKNFVITVGQIKTASIRLSIYQKLLQLGANIATIVSPKAYISSRATIGIGTIIMHGACINTGVTIGVNSIINTNALIEHDTTIGDHCHLSTGSIINGTCRINDQVFVGSGAVVANNINIVRTTVIGAGTVVIKNITEAGIYAGNPHKKIGNG